jgi:ferredoxin
MNSELEKAGRVGDYLEVGELMCYDALTREESCGAHFREEHQTSDGEAARNDQDFAYISASTGEAPEANSIPIRHHVAEAAFDAAACIGCGACVATCKNSSAALFTSAKVAQLALLPQGQIEARRRVLQMVDGTDKEGFGHCSNTEACQVECPQQISVLHIARMNWEYNCALLSPG